MTSSHCGLTAVGGGAIRALGQDALGIAVGVDRGTTGAESIAKPIE